MSNPAGHKPPRVCIGCDPQLADDDFRVHHDPSNNWITVKVTEVRTAESATRPIPRPSNPRPAKKEPLADWGFTVPEDKLSPIWFVLGAVVLLFLAILGASVPKDPYARPPDMSYEDWNYVNNRFRDEGYSKEDSARAAKAVLEFQQAQEIQKQRMFEERD